MDGLIRVQKRKRRIALVVFLASSAMFGAADLLLNRNTGWIAMSGILDTIIGIIAIVAWCKYDAQIHTYPMTRGLKLLIWLFAVIGVPLYLVRSRGWIGAAKIGFGLPAFLLSIGLYYGGWYAAHAIGTQMGYFDR
jgi:hypothetical protein